MDRRSWLWRRKSSEQSPGETESTGSLSSHSERFSDDQAYVINSTQSPEVTSKSGSNYEDCNENVKGLTDRLASALLEISAKEELVKQHAKVAEEAVSGWEKAENEASVLKKKLESSDQKNSALEDRLGHLDGALKECVRQLRQAREDQEHKIHEILTNKSQEWDRLKSMLESQITELQTQLRESDERAKLENCEKENARLNLELLSQSQELEIGILERDLSVEAAESTSKQYLESMKKVAKLESEIRKLKALTGKVLQNNDWKSLSASESGTHKMNNLEENEHESLKFQFRRAKETENKPTTPLIEIDLMDDFLEMERIAALPVIESETVSNEKLLSDRSESMIQRAAILEEKLEAMEGEKVKLEMALRSCQTELEKSKSKLSKAVTELKELRNELLIANESKVEADEQAKAVRRNNVLVESKLRDVESEVKALTLKVNFLEEEVHKERAVSSDNLVQCRKLKDELSSMKLEAEIHRERTNLDFKFTQEKELALAAENFAECQKTIASLGQHLKSLAGLEDFVFDFDFDSGVGESSPGPINGSKQS